MLTAVVIFGGYEAPQWGMFPQDRDVLQSVAFRGRRVSCIMHGRCYFHHMVLSGVIVVSVLSAQIALSSQIVVLVSTLTPSHSLRVYSLCTWFHCVREMGLRRPSGFH